MLALHEKGVAARLLQGDDGVGSVDLERVSRVETPQPDVQLSLRHPHLHGLVIQVQKRYLGAGIHAQGSRAHVELRPAGDVGPEVITGGEGYS